MMGEGRLEWGSSATSTSLRLEGHQAWAWRRVSHPCWFALCSLHCEQILGFAPSGQPILPNTSHTADPDTIRREKLGWEEISLQAAKIVSFIDLAGHEKYLKTTLYGLTSGAPSCVILIVGANAGLIGMSKEHLAIALALSVPVVVCITKASLIQSARTFSGIYMHIYKIDMTPPNVLAETVKQVVKILKSPGCR